MQNRLTTGKKTQKRNKKIYTAQEIIFISCIMGMRKSNEAGSRFALMHVLRTWAHQSVSTLITNNAYICF
jgi:hypothetical protein